MTKKLKAYVAVATFLVLIAVATWTFPEGVHGWWLLLATVATVPFAVWAVNVIMEYDDDLRSR